MPPDKPAEVKRPRGRPPTHGAYSKFTLVPLTTAADTEIREAMLEEGRVILPGDEMLISTLARLNAKITLIDRWFAQHGIFRDEVKGELNPLFHDQKACITLARQLMGDLGLTSASRARLKGGYATEAPLADQIQDARRR